MRVRAIVLHALCPSFCCLFGQAVSTSPGGTVLAQAGELRISLGELEQTMAAQLFQARQQYYRAQREALDQMVEDQLLAAEARRQHTTVEALLDRHVNRLVIDPTDDQMRVYHEGLNTDQSFEAMREKILQHIRDLRAAKARSAYLKSLKDQAQIVVTFPAPSADVHVGSAAVRGSLVAPVRVVEFGDYQCPYCREIHPAINRLLEQYGAKLSFTFLDLPLAMHPWAQKAAEAAHCAGAQGKYWEFHDALFEASGLDVPQLKSRARDLGLDAAVFDKCVDSSERAGEVEQQASEARRFRISGTPSFFVNGHAFTGSAEYDALRSMIDQELAARN